MGVGWSFGGGGWSEVGWRGWCAGWGGWWRGSGLGGEGEREERKGSEWRARR